MARTLSKIVPKTVLNNGEESNSKLWRGEHAVENAFWTLSVKQMSWEAKQKTRRITVPSLDFTSSSLQKKVGMSHESSKEALPIPSPQLDACIWCLSQQLPQILRNQAETKRTSHTFRILHSENKIPREYTWGGKIQDPLSSLGQIIGRDEKIGRKNKAGRMVLLMKGRYYSDSKSNIIASYKNIQEILKII